MHSEIAVSLLSESVHGDVSAQWGYRIHVEIRSLGLMTRGVLRVPSHVVGGGPADAPPPVRPLVLMAGGCAGESQVKLLLEVTKADVLDAGLGTVERTIVIRSAAETGTTREVMTDLSAVVMAVPGLKGGTGTLTVQLRLETRCVEARRPGELEVWVH